MSAADVTLREPSQEAVEKNGREWPGDLCFQGQSGNGGIRMPSPICPGSPTTLLLTPCPDFKTDSLTFTMVLAEYLFGF